MTVRIDRTAGIGRRLEQNPLITARDVKPSMPGLEVVSAFNAATAQLDGETILLLRVAERPRSDIDPPPGAMTLDLDGPHPVLRPLPTGYTKHDVIGMCFLDTSATKPRVVVAYIPKDLPGLDLRDPRSIRYRNGTGVLGVINEGYTDYLAQMSHLRVARSTDGVKFTVDETPAVAPNVDVEEYGVEDPRCTFLNGVFQITYVSVSRWGITTSLATTEDFRTFERRGVIFLPDHKDVVIFPERIGGKYVALTRPMPQSFSRIFGIWIAFSDDLFQWGGHETVCLPRWNHWDELRTGASAVPFRTKDGSSSTTGSTGPTATRWARSFSTGTTREESSPARPCRSWRRGPRTSGSGSSTTRSSRAASCTSTRSGSACTTARRTRASRPRTSR